MKKYAITGGIATGKSTFSAWIKERGLPLIDCDGLVHEAYVPGGPIYEAVVASFGDHILDDLGIVDRKQLGALIFSSDAHRRQLDAITHPIIRQLVQDQLTRYSASGAPVVFVDVPLLFESGLEGEYDASILIDTDETLQLQRLMSRNYLAEEEAMARIEAQMRLAEKRKKATYILINDGSLEDFRQKATALIDHLLEL